MALSGSFCGLFDDIKKENEADRRSTNLIIKIQNKSFEAEGFSLRNGNLMKDGKYFLCEDLENIPPILKEFHSSTLGGHLGIEIVSNLQVIFIAMNSYGTKYIMPELA